MALLLRLSDSLVASRGQTFHGSSSSHSPVPPSLVDICSNAANALKISWLCSVPSPSRRINIAYLDFSPAGIAFLQTPFDHLSVEHAQRPLVEPCWVEHPSHGFLHDFARYNFLAACGTSLFFFLGPVATTLSVDWVPAAAFCLYPHRETLTRNRVSPRWLPLRNLVANSPPIPGLFRRFITTPVHYLMQLVIRLRAFGNHIAGGETGGPVGLDSASGSKARGKRHARSDRSSTPSDTSRKKNKLLRGEGQRTATKTKAKVDKKRKTFACHFYKHDPVTHSRCRGYCFAGVRHAKRHYTDKGRGQHRQPIHCPRCFTTFNTNDENQVHIRQTNCELGECGFDLSLLSDDKINEIRDLKCGRGDDGSGVWFKIWDIIFEGQERPLSPYSDDVEELAVRRRVEPRMAEGLQELRLPEAYYQQVMGVYRRHWGLDPMVTPVSAAHGQPLAPMLNFPVATPSYSTPTPVTQTYTYGETPTYGVDFNDSHPSTTLLVSPYHNQPNSHTNTPTQQGIPQAQPPYGIYDQPGPGVNNLFLRFGPQHSITYSPRMMIPDGAWRYPDYLATANEVPDIDAELPPTGNQRYRSPSYYLPR
ncbi:hypothetical protein LZ30DRAFT_700654 [Colletotrichum cereale]|nr:hypothetical protein LZ30DRAFT_700654 [Colletotrichum cereale]